MTVKLTTFEPAEYLETKEDGVLFMNEAFVTDDHKHIAHCLDIVAHAKVATNTTRETWGAREQLYKSLSEESNRSH